MSLSELLWKNNGTSDKVVGNTNALSAMFSESKRSNALKIEKPTEFSKKRPVSAVEKDESKEKKKKPRKRGPEEPVNSLSDASCDSHDNETEKQIDIANTNDVENKTDNTVFVGNVPCSETKKTISKLFSKFGEIESIRLRSVPIAGAKIDDAGNQDLVKKVCANSRKFGDQKQSYNAYIVYKNKESVNEALSMNEVKLNGRHLRVDGAEPSHFDPHRSVFVGGLPYYSDEEELRSYFGSVLPDGNNSIKGVRLIRDPETLVCKGIGFVLLSDRDAVSKALTLHEKKFKNKYVLRIMTCGRRAKRDVRKDGHVSDLKHSQSTKSALKKVNSSAYERRKQDKSKKELSVAELTAAVEKDMQMKKIKLKNHNSSAPNKSKKAKRLGGVIKKAIHAANAKPM